MGNHHATVKEPEKDADGYVDLDKYKEYLYNGIVFMKSDSSVEKLVPNIKFVLDKIDDNMITTFIMSQSGEGGIYILKDSSVGKDEVVITTKLKIRDGVSSIVISMQAQKFVAENRNLFIPETTGVFTHQGILNNNNDRTTVLPESNSNNNDEFKNITDRITGEEKYTLEKAIDLPFESTDNTPIFYLLDENGYRICCLTMKNGKQVRNYNLEELRVTGEFSFTKEECSVDHILVIIKRFNSLSKWCHSATSGSLLTVNELTSMIEDYLKRFFYYVPSLADTARSSPKGYFIEKLLKNDRVYLKCMSYSIFYSRIITLFDNVFKANRIFEDMIITQSPNYYGRQHNKTNGYIEQIERNIMHYNTIDMDIFLQYKNSITFDHVENYFSTRLLAATPHNYDMYNPLIKKDSISTLCESLYTLTKCTGDSDEQKLASHIPEFEAFLRDKANLTSKKSTFKCPGGITNMGVNLPDGLIL